MRKLIPFLAPLLALAFAGASPSAKASTVECRLDFTMSGWSVFYKRS
jgi:ABC-type nitrate/sulfonate/bicarbonate transport system substrate-binding protein